MKRGRWARLLALAYALPLLVSCTSSAPDPGAETAPASSSAPSAAAASSPPPSASPASTSPVDPGDPVRRPRGGSDQPGRPDIVLVLVDDLSMELLATMRSAAVMAERGAWYPLSFVVDSLCCVSRASLFTGQYPHQSGVRTNASRGDDPPTGGYPAYAAYGSARRSFPVRLERSGYTTGFVGKFLNEYEPTASDVLPPPPAGWSGGAVVFGDAYDGWEFRSAALGEESWQVRHHPAPPADAGPEEKDRAYAGTVIEEMALDFIDARQREERQRHKDGRADEPWFLEVATYAVHNRVAGVGQYPGDPVFPPAYADRPGPGRPRGNCGLLACRELTVADLPGFGDDRADNAALRADGSRAVWRTNVPTLTPQAAERSMRARAQMLQSVDRMLSRILATVDDDTYVVLTADNGMHLGQHGLERSKGTPYDSDARVPLLVVGPGVEPGERAEVVSNIDLAPTFEDLAGLPRARDDAGVSLVPTFGDPALARRDAAFLEHTHSGVRYGDPDQPFSGDTLNLVPDFTAVRTPTGLLVRLDLDPSAGGEDVAWEFYSYQDVGWERRNGWADPAHADEVAALTRRLEAFRACDQVGDDPVPLGCRRLSFR